jgi:hypothetical protein
VQEVRREVGVTEPAGEHNFLLKGEWERVFHKFPKYHTNILLGEFSAKVGREDILNQQMGLNVYSKLPMRMELEY